MTTFFLAYFDVGLKLAQIQVYKECPNWVHLKYFCEYMCIFDIKEVKGIMSSKDVENEIRKFILELYEIKMNKVGRIAILVI